MTDAGKAIAFATHCLKWTDAKTLINGRGTLVYDGHSHIGFSLENTADLERTLEQFLGKRYFNRARVP
jgi:hypothetical protein